MDDICLIRSMHGDHNDHAQATLGIHTGSVTFARPCIGSWVSYGLGTENRNLPSFVVLAPALPYAGAQVWSSDFLPGVHSGTLVTPGADPMPNLTRRAPTPELQKMELGLLERFNKMHQQSRPGDPTLAARIKSFETAFGMQMEMPQVLDLSKETDATLEALRPGARLDERLRLAMPGGAPAGRARRAVHRADRRGRIEQLGRARRHEDARAAGEEHRPPDRRPAARSEIARHAGRHAGRLDHRVRPHAVARQPEGTSASQPGVLVLAGRRRRRRRASSTAQSDEMGWKVASDDVHVHDFHATILHLLGFDHTKLTFRHAGRDFRLTDVAGNVVKKIVA